MSFVFDGKVLQGVAGDISSLARAVRAARQRLYRRVRGAQPWFKYHRPRGIVTAGPEEPCALVDLISAAGREPNCLATTLPLYPGLVAESQHGWPSLALDALAVDDLLAPFLPAGFYYKTFMSPGWAWERVFEPLIRRAAGLGRLAAVVVADADPAEIVHDHADVLVVGAGAAGIAAALALGAARAARAAGRAGQRRLAAARCWMNAGMAGAAADARAAARRWRRYAAQLRTTVLGAYGHGVFGAHETLSAAERAQCGGLRERLRVIRARRVVLACGAPPRAPDRLPRQ